MCADIVACRADEIADIFENHQVHILGLYVVESLPGHLRIQMAHSAGMELNRLYAGCLLYLDSIYVAIDIGLHDRYLDAEMTRQGLREVTGYGLPVTGEKPDLVILENVGNLVCPAEFDTGAVKNAMILSVPEGHDKPLKYPLMFSVCDVVVINKIDVLPYFDFDLDKCKEYIHMRNPKATAIPICAKTGEGVEDFAEWLLAQVKEWKTL